MISKTKNMSIALYWHIHQPVYQLVPGGDYIMPWVRLHAVKDYLPILLHVKNFKKLRLNLNITPVLIDSLLDYSNNAHDIHSRLTITPQDQLTDEDKIYILNNFFDVNYQTRILASPKYNEMYQKVKNNKNADISILTSQEYADLMALFNLAWFNQIFIDKDKELKALVEKQYNYSYEDRVNIINIQRKLIKKIIPTLKDLIKKDRIDVTTSPYYHAILPILLGDVDISESSVISEVMENELLENDAATQVSMALDKIETVLGVRPKGLWPSEQCVSPKTLNLLPQLGIKWTISDESILSTSIHFEFEHDFKGYINEPYHLLKTYNYKADSGDVKMIFREATIPKLISFEYSNHDSVITATDLYDRIKIIQSKILSSPDEEHLLTIAMDGENCWENYADNGNTFISTFYNLIEKDKTLNTVKISEYLENTQEDKTLSKITSGSWINRNFKLWIDEPVKDLAWSYLYKVKEDLKHYKITHPENPNIKDAQKEIMVCEGSDWYWWYGDPNDSGRDNIFDFIFRTHLKNVYKYLGMDIPSYLDAPLNDLISPKASKFPKTLITPTINGKGIVSAYDDWQNAGCIEIPDGPIFRESKLFDKIRFGNDKDYFYLKFHLNKYLKENPDLMKRTYQMYIYTRAKGGTQDLSPVRLISKTHNIPPVSYEKFHNEIQIAIRNNKVQLLRLIKAVPQDMWVLEQTKDIEVAYDEVLDLKIPFDLLEINDGSTLEFLFINANYGIKDFYVPNDSLISLYRSELSLKN